VERGRIPFLVVCASATVARRVARRVVAVNFLAAGANVSVNGTIAILDDGRFDGRRLAGGGILVLRDDAATAKRMRQTQTLATIGSKK
jgi:hypothetical protein